MSQCLHAPIIVYEWLQWEAAVLWKLVTGGVMTLLMYFVPYVGFMS